MLNDEFKQGYEDALEDFHSARRKAVLGEALSRLTGKNSRMIPYDEVRTQLGAIETPKRTLKEIPLDSIVGTVGRYQDFNRKLLPLNPDDSDRWARVRTAVNDPLGLPPIEVYQIGDAYFILDGHHRASVAREYGSKHIQAYVREVYTRVPLSPEDQPEDIILKSEYAEFLKQTRVDDLIPEADLRVTVPGSAEQLLEHISVHRYFQGIDEHRPIPYEEAVKHWYHTVYCPINAIIKRRNLLKDFPGRTEADLYLWIMEHRSTIENDLGWKISPLAAADDLIFQNSPTFYNLLHRIASKVAKLPTVEQLEPAPPAGAWRETRAASSETGLFSSILAAVTGDETGWPAVDLAVDWARKESAFLDGLHIVSDDRGKNPTKEDTERIKRIFESKCEAGAVQGALAVDTGNVARTVLEKSSWADLLVLSLSYPPPFLSLKRLRSGLRNLIRLCRIPMMLVPPVASLEIKTVLLAYGGGARADEALYLSAYLAQRWKHNLVVATIRRGAHDELALSEKARTYLESRQITNALYVPAAGDPAQTILRICKEKYCDLILMGGYEGSLWREAVLGSTVDRVLWGTPCPVLICH